MKIKILVVLIVLMFAGLEVYGEDEECDNFEVIIDMQVTAYNEEYSYHNDTSDYQIPRFREDDWLQLDIEKLKEEHNGEVEYEELKVKFRNQFKPCFFQ